METVSTKADAVYGARPVSVDIARGRALSERPDLRGSGPQIGRPEPQPNHNMVADRLSLAHWPRGHQIIVCGLAGGTGRTTMAGLMATVLAELPFAHIWPPIAVVDAVSHTFGSTPRRWDVVDQEDPQAPEQVLASGSTRSGAWALTGHSPWGQRRDFSALLVDSPTGLPSELPSVIDDPLASIVLMVRPDQLSLADGADALVWLNDHSPVGRSRISVVINHGVGRPDRGSKAAATALGIRCATVHSLPADPTLGPDRVLPSGRDLPVRLRRRIARVCLDVWSQTQRHNSPAALSTPHHKEQA